MSPRSKSLLIVVFAAGLAGCADYMNHRDSITLGAGNAPEANIGIQTVDPFRPESENTDIKVDNNKVGQSYRRYVAPCDPDVVQCSPGGAGGAVEAEG